MEGEKNKVLTNYQLIIIDTESRVTSPGVENLREKIESQVRVLENPYCVSTSHCISGIRIIARNVVLKKINICTYLCTAKNWIFPTLGLGAAT